MRLKMSGVLFKLLVLLCLVPGNLLLDPFTSGFGIGLGMAMTAAWNSRNSLVCMFKECCKEPYIRSNLVGLEETLQEKVFGQHIVLDTVIKSVKGHLKKDDPKKALALSFHGMTGTGKNFVSEFVARSLYEHGMKSQYVHQFISTAHFPLQSQTDQYKTNLHSWIKGNVSQCERSLFIFDEVDKLAPGVVDSVKPFLDFHPIVDGVDYRKSIFIFISNTGGKDIAKLTFQHWKNGKQREDLSLVDLDVPLSQAAFNDLGGLHKADIIEKALIDASIAFLPLEKRHVKMCIRRELDDRIERQRKVEEALPVEERKPLKSYTEEDVNSLAEERTYWPEDYKIFSTSGCKKIDIIVDRFFEDDL